MFYLRHENIAGRPQFRRTASRILKHCAALHEIIYHNFQRQEKFTGATAAMRPSAIFSTGEAMLRISKLETPLSLCQTGAHVQQLWILYVCDMQVLSVHSSLFMILNRDHILMQQHSPRFMLRRFLNKWPQKQTHYTLVFLALLSLCVYSTTFSSKF